MIKSRARDEFDVILYLVLGLAAIGTIMFLIDWNARRQAAAITREMLRPVTAEEQQQIERLVDDAMPMPSEAEMRQARALLFQHPPEPSNYPTPVRDLTPLNDDERCINAQRFRRLTNGWEEIGTC